MKLKSSKFEVNQNTPLITYQLYRLCLESPETDTRNQLLIKWSPINVTEVICEFSQKFFQVVNLKKLCKWKSERI